jgi:hypothetical protein
VCFLFVHRYYFSRAESLQSVSGTMRPSAGMVAIVIFSLPVKMALAFMLKTASLRSLSGVMAADLNNEFSHS